MNRALSWFIDCPKDSSINWNSDNAWAAGEGIICVEVNTTVTRAAYLSLVMGIGNIFKIDDRSSVTIAC